MTTTNNSAVRERPILFSAPMVRAILDGTKTQTRRVVRGVRADNCMPLRKATKTRGGVITHVMDAPARGLCPYGQAGDRLWVRETFALESCVDGELPPHNDNRPVQWAPKDDYECVYPAWVQAHYRATDPAPDLCCDSDSCRQCRENDMGPHWRPSIHMPRWACRIELEVTGVRVERLQDISDADALAEGVDRTNTSIAGYARERFQRLWAATGGDWDANPWVWVVEFKRVENNEEKANGGG